MNYIEKYQCGEYTKMYNKDNFRAGIGEDGMCDAEAVGKQHRLLSLQQDLLAGRVINKKECAARFGVTEKSIQRDLDDLKAFFAEGRDGREVLYDSHVRGYRLARQQSSTLTNSEVLAVCKILLESRSMVKEEMFPILDKLIRGCTPAEQLQQVEALIQNERFHYVEPHHGRRFIESLWQLGTAVKEQRVLHIHYRKMDGTISDRQVEPVGLLFSEYYFYLAAFIRGIDKQEHFANPQDKSPTIYRIDRITQFQVTDEHFRVPYKDRFQEGEMRKRIQFMYGGKLEKVRFVYTGPNLEAVLDRLPTGKVVGSDGRGYPIAEAEVFSGNGLDMWLKSQGDWVELENTEVEDCT